MANNSFTIDGESMRRPGTLTYDSSHGIAPATAIVRMLNSALENIKGDNKGHTIKINDESGSSITIKDLFIAKTQNVATLKDDSVVDVFLEDKRSLWADKTITGHFNLLQEDGKQYIVGTTKSGTTPWTFDEILQKIFDKLGEKVTVKTGITNTPSVSFELAPCNAALSAMLEDMGWDVTVDPDGTVKLIQLFNPSESFKTDKLVFAHTVENRDIAHRKPKKARICYRTLREKKFNTWEAVMQYDEYSELEAPGTWDTVAHVLDSWGTNTADIHKRFYQLFEAGNGGMRMALELGGGVTGIERVKSICSDMYRHFRLSDTDRAKFLPLIKESASAGSISGRGVLAEGVRAIEASFHYTGRINQGSEGALNHKTPKRKHFDNGSGVPFWPVKITNGAEGIVSFIGGPPMCNVTCVGPGWVDKDYQLDGPSSMKLVVAYIKKGSTNPEDDYKIVEKEFSGQNNGQTKTFFDESKIYRETDDGAGGFTSRNGTEIEAAANKFLADYEKTFNYPDPEEHQFVGVDSGVKINGCVRSIKINMDAPGIVTVVKLNTSSPINPFGTNIKEKNKSISVEAERAYLFGLDKVSGGNGGGSSVYNSPTTKTIPYADDAGQRHRPDGFREFHASPSFINDEVYGLMVAEDLTYVEGPPNDCCEKTTQTTGGGTTKFSGGASNPTGGGVQTTGGSVG